MAYKTLSKQLTVEHVCRSMIRKGKKKQRARFKVNVLLESRFLSFIKFRSMQNTVYLGARLFVLAPSGTGVHAREKGKRSVKAVLVGIYQRGSWIGLDVDRYLLFTAARLFFHKHLAEHVTDAL